MLQDELKKVKTEVDEFLKKFFEEKKKEIGKVDKNVEDLINCVADITLRGGDRFRPFMVWLGATSGKKEEVKDKREIDTNLLKIMCSIELLHSFALIHDDIIDRAETRRGGATIKPDEKAILAGDMCFTFADELLNGFPVAVKKEYDILREEVIAGELLDVLYARESWLKPELRHKINLIHEYKTARYGFLRPFLMGYIINNNVVTTLGLSLQKILITIGIAFQFQDDFLDLFGDERLGKQLGGDIIEGNLTIFHKKLVEQKDHFDFKRYTEIWHNDKATAEEIKWVKEQVENSGIKKEVEQEMQDLINSAKTEIEKLESVNPKAKKLLAEMADFVVKREY